MRVVPNPSGCMIFHVAVPPETDSSAIVPASPTAKPAFWLFPGLLMSTEWNVTVVGGPATRAHWFTDVV